MPPSKFAIVTGASTGIGLEIAKLAAADGYDLLVAADTPFVDAAAGLKDLRGRGAPGRSRSVDPAGRRPIARCRRRTRDRRARRQCRHGHRRGVPRPGAGDWRHSLDTNVTGTLLLIQPVLKTMVARGEGRVLITGSIAGHVAGSFHAVYNGTKAFIDSFAAAIGNEMKDSGVTITCLKPGATETEFFARAGMLDTKVGQMKKDDPADIAKTGWEAMLKGDMRSSTG